MKDMRLDLALVRVLDALEVELLAAPNEEIQAAAAETGMKAGALLADPEWVLAFLSASSPGDPRSLFCVPQSPPPAAGEVGDAEHRRVGGVSPSSRRDRKGGDSTPHPDLRSDLPLKGGGDRTSS